MNGLAVIGEGGVGTIALGVEISESDVEGAIVRAILQGGVELLFGVVEFVDADERVGEIDEGTRVGGLGLDGFFKHDDGFANVALLNVEDAEIVTGFGELGIGVDGSFELSFGGVAVAVGKFEEAELIVGGGQAGIEFESTFEFAAGVGVIAEMIERHGE